MEKETLKTLRTKLTSLGAKTTGTKAVLAERLQLWEDNHLSRKLVNYEVIPSQSRLPFPPFHSCSPISGFPKSLLKHFTLNAIQHWFEARKSVFSLTAGRKLFLKKFLKTVIGRLDGDLLYLSCFCAAEKKKHTDYEIQLVLKTDINNASIQQANCQCAAGDGMSASCKHIAALAFFAEHFGITGESIELVSCTSALQSWHKPASGRLLKPESVDSMLKITRDTKDKYKIKYLPTLSDLSNILCNNSCSSALLKSRRVNVHSYLNDHDYISNPASQFMLNVNHEPDLTRLERSTRKQKLTKKWFEARKTRITASIAGAGCKSVRCGKFSEGIAVRQLKPKRICHLKPVKWGLDHEEDALKEYCKTTGSTLKKCGIFVDSEKNFLGASPDAVTMDNEIIIEIKCPYSVRFGFPAEVAYLKEANNAIALDKKHNYHFQCQLQMHVTKIQRCDFVVWTTNGIYIENIKYDTQFCESMLLDLTNYYDRVFAPMAVKELYQ